MYNNIVVGFDDSKFSKAALLESSRWIKRHGGKILLVHAVFFDTEEFSIAPGQREKRFELGKKICFQTKETLSAEFGLNGQMEALVCEGEPHEVVVDIANSKKADLIAMGTHGRKGFKKLFMGSVTSRVIASSPCDVFVINKPCEECAGRYDSILLSYDGSELGKKALKRACDLAKIDNSEITALYVIPHYEVFITRSMEESMIQDAQKTMEDAKKIASGHGVEIKTEIVEEHVAEKAAEKIVETANRLKSNLIIRGPNRWSGINKVMIGSVAEDVIINAPCPVLIIK
jgi:nucleotide-binding universal stress UspA family protein